MSASIESPGSPRRNAPCPCGSGRKLKLCCGAAGMRHPGVELARPGLPRLEVLTAASREREAAERFRRMQAAPPDTLFAARHGPAAPRARAAEAAERHRERGRRASRSSGEIGLVACDSCFYPEHNRRAVTTASLWQARQPVYSTSVERWRRYEPWIGELRRILPEQPATHPRALILPGPPPDQQPC